MELGCLPPRRLCKVDYVFADHPTFLERVDGLTGQAFLTLGSQRKIARFWPRAGAKLYGPEWGKDLRRNARGRAMRRARLRDSEKTWTCCTQDFADNQARFAYFCKASLKAIQDGAVASSESRVCDHGQLQCVDTKCRKLFS